MKKHIKSVLISVLSLLIVLFSALPVMADVLENTTWDTPLTIKANVRKVDSFTITDNYQINFSAPGTFLATASDDGNFFNGTYTVATNGKVTTQLDETQLQDYIAAEIVNLAAQKGVVITNPWVGNFAIKDTSMAKNKNGVLTYTMKIKIDFALNATIDGEYQTTTGIFMIGGKHSQSIPEADELAGTSFSLDTEETISATGLGKDKNPWFLVLHFGPNTAYGLEAGEFMFQSGTDEQRGTYTRSGNKGVIKLEISQSDIEAGIKYKFEESASEFYDIQNLDINMINQKFYCGFKKGILSINAQVVYSYEALVDGLLKSGTGKYNLKGSGSQL